MEDARTLLRHILATLAYRAGKTLREAPEGFAAFSLSASASRTAFASSETDGDAPAAGRTPLQILAHMGDLIEWALSVASGGRGARDVTPLEWQFQVDRFFAALERFDTFLASTDAMAVTPARLVQGPIADALTHVGQLALLRRECGAPIQRESYVDAVILIGRVGFDQAPPRR